MLAYSAPSPRLITDRLAWTLPPPFLVALFVEDDEPRLLPALAPPVNRRPRPEPDELAEEVEVEGDGDDAVGDAIVAASRRRGDPWGGGDATS